ncbi:MAG: ComF family protein [Clostridia bacterium]|nr:ComF family protein [Clostridia bacterium]
MFLQPCLFCSRAAEGCVCEGCARELDAAASLISSAVPFADVAFTVFEYGQKKVRRAVFQLKRRADARLADTLARFLARETKDYTLGALCVTYVPRRLSQKWRQGTDQAREIARAFAKHAGLPCVRLLVRRGVSRRQHDLEKEARAANVHGKFRAKGPLCGTVVLIDDIITTGATASEASRVLRAAGAERVVVLAVSRGGEV